MSEKPPQLHMRRTLEALPDLSVPAGYKLRTLNPTDMTAWASFLNQNGELGEWDSGKAEPYFAPDSRMPLDGSFVLTEGAALVATAQLHLHRDGPYAPTPELGWVAASPSHQGRGLGYAASLAVMRYAAATGHEAIMLRTDDHRLPAIATYLKLGFEPWMYDPTAPERWRMAIQALDDFRQGITRTDQTALDAKRSGGTR